MAHVPLGYHGVVPSFPANSSSSSQQPQPMVYVQRDTIAMQRIVQDAPQTPTKEMLWTENQALQQHLSWTQNEANKQIHYTKEAAVQKLENALHGYSQEFHSACEVYGDRVRASEAQEVSTYKAVSNSARQQTAAIQVQAQHAMQRAELEMNLAKQKEMTAMDELSTTEQHLAQSRVHIKKVTSEGQTQSQALFQTQAQVQSVTQDATAHMDQLRFEKIVQQQEHEMKLAALEREKEDLRTKAAKSWTEQNDAKKELEKQLMDSQAEKEASRLRHAQDKANQETKMANMQKQMEEFQRKLQEHPKTILLPSSRESTIVGEPRGSRPGGAGYIWFYKRCYRRAGRISR